MAGPTTTTNAPTRPRGSGLRRWTRHGRPRRRRRRHRRRRCRCRRCRRHRTGRRCEAPMAGPTTTTSAPIRQHGSGLRSWTRRRRPRSPCSPSPRAGGGGGMTRAATTTMRPARRRPTRRRDRPCSLTTSLTTSLITSLTSRRRAGTRRRETRTAAQAWRPPPGASPQLLGRLLIPCLAGARPGSGPHHGLEGGAKLRWPDLLPQRTHQ